ncbi:MAG TPA: ABC transporter ATP-binding protein [Solirubrobacteraceae bacterium]|jgi:iron(III) transport system ATP-binding protein|nr:ABC transporter ATP-binding protein [Solirubrobacteraceae bacterium]
MPAADRTDPPAAIEAEGLVRAFGDRRAIDGVDLRLREGGILAVLGPSGSGKTTLLRMIAGFERPDAGVVRIAGGTVAGPGTWVEPEARRIGMVFQQGALFPHLTVNGNVAFGARRAGRVGECLELVGLADRAADFPHELSGGERQRVALARALAADPAVVLLDEPFSALDAGLRERLREDVAAILRGAGTSALLVTHDQSEALSLADTVAVLRDGRLEQVGTPEEVYERPRTHWVASFLGDADVLPGTASGGVAQCELGRFAVASDLDGVVQLVVRPESVAIGHRPSRDADAKAVVVGRSFYGHDQLVELELPSGRRLRSRRLGFPAWHEGDRVRVWIDGPVTALAHGAAQAQPQEPAGTAR